MGAKKLAGKLGQENVRQGFHSFAPVFLPDHVPIAVWAHSTVVPSELPVTVTQYETTLQFVRKEIPRLQPQRSPVEQLLDFVGQVTAKEPTSLWQFTEHALGVRIVGIRGGIGPRC